MSEETTARPWEVRKDHMGSWWVADMGQRKVAYVGHESDARAEGDARIIAAAPDLLAALEKARQQIRHYYDAAIAEGFEGPSVFDMASFELLMLAADAAIAAARGIEDT